MGIPNDRRPMDSVHCFISAYQINQTIFMKSPGRKGNSMRLDQVNKSQRTRQTLLSKVSLYPVYFPQTSKCGDCSGLQLTQT